jgi:hypothetical protein
MPISLLQKISWITVSRLLLTENKSIPQPEEVNEKRAGENSPAL